MSTAGPEIGYEGVSFESIRAALAAMYFMYKGMTVKEWREALGYVLPMQHNFENPIKPGSQDTWIQFWINEDDRLAQDYNTSEANRVRKVAHITVRFLGRRAETWAKAFHHLTKRRTVSVYFAEYCNARMLEYVGPVVPVNVDYFGVGNTTVAHDLSFQLEYDEVMEFDWETLDFISFPAGEIKTGG
jgi:hypothetical protein